MDTAARNAGCESHRLCSDFAQRVFNILRQPHDQRFGCRMSRVRSAIRRSAASDGTGKVIRVTILL